MKTIETIRPFKKMLMTIGNLPTAFLESMTYYEALAWFCDFLQNKVIPTVNNNAEAVKELQDLFVELHDYVENYFDNLDVQEEINNKLDEMAQDGTLERLISNYLNLDSNVITMDREFRFLVESGKYLENLDSSINYFGFMQGATYTKNGNFIIAYMSSDENHETNNLVKLVEYTSNGSIAREAILKLNHANSLAFDEDNEILYVVSGSKFVDSSQQNDYTLFVINYNNLTITNSYSYVEQITAVSYDNIKKKLYIGYAGNYIYELDNTYTIINTITLDTPTIVNSAGKQSICINNDIIYACYIRPDMIISYNIDGSLYKIYSVPKFGNGNTMFVGEIEDLSFYNNKMSCFSSALTTYYSQLYQINVFNLDFVHNVVNNPKWFAERGFLANNINSVFVDINNNNLNPDGSTNNPFKEIFEAINYLSSPRYQNGGRIHVRAGNYRNIFLFNNNFEIDESGTGDIVIGGVYAISSKINLQACKIIKNNSGLDYPVTLKNSEIIFTNLRLGSFMQYGIFSEQSKLYYRGNEIVTDDTLNDNQFSIYLDAGSSIEIGQGLSGYNDIYYASKSSFINPNIVNLAYNLNLHYGPVTLNKEKYAFNNGLFKFICFKCRVNGISKVFKFPTNISTFNIEDSYMGNTTSKICLNKVSIIKNNDDLEITSNQWARYTGEDGTTWTTTDKTNNTINNNFIVVEDIYLTNIA